MLKVKNEIVIPEQNLSILCDIDLIEKDKALIACLTGIIDFNLNFENLN